MNIIYYDDNGDYNNYIVDFKEHTMIDRYEALKHMYSEWIKNKISIDNENVV